MDQENITIERAISQRDEALAKLSMLEKSIADMSHPNIVEVLAQLTQARADDDRNNQLMVELMRRRDELLAALEECKGWTHRAIELEVSFSMQQAQRSAITRAEAAIAAVKGEK